ncbi:hypothetical protein HN937_13495, partial [Candidatus Poribacteria bacterium]|nr:hypothetical protein [Candidatus Poribacteria bacterium]
PDTGASTEFPTDHGVSDVSPDGQWYATLGSGLAAGVATREVATYRADGSEYRVLTELDLGQLNSLEWAPDGRSLLVAARIGGGNRIYVIDAEDGAAVAMLPDGEEGYDAHWSADGGSIYYIGDRGGLRRVDVVDRSMHVIDRWFAGHLFAVSPDGKYLLSESPWEGQADLAAFDLSGVFVSRITDHEALPRRADWFIPRHLLPVSPVRTRAMTWGMLRDGVE